MINFSIILADDEQQILFGMKNGIDWESLGFSVVGTAQNGKEALELIEEYHPDLLISDIKMPFMDGLELSKILHDNYINTKIILFSGWDDFEYARTAISYGVSQYLMKPIDYDEMQKLLTNIHEELEKEYAEKLNRTRLENIYAESIPLLRCVQLRKHSKAREKRYSFGYAVSFIFACYQILWTFPKSRYLCSRYLPLVCG